jgi:hypothetical protein
MTKPSMSNACGRAKGHKGLRRMNIGRWCRELHLEGIKVIDTRNL